MTFAIHSIDTRWIKHSCFQEANTTFRMLLNESTRRLKLLLKKLGNCIERARPYYDATEVAKKAQVECQKAAVSFRKANGRLVSTACWSIRGWYFLLIEIHAAAKETVALAEHRFMSNQHEWQFDNAWQEMLNHATMKVRNYWYVYVSHFSYSWKHNHFWKCHVHSILVKLQS